jgi:predicted RNA-binding protein with PIN domain
VHWIIDGHNLIPQVPGLSLHDPDDESKLILWLAEFCRIRQDTMDLYFDKAPVGFAKTKRIGRITAHFIQTGKTADDAILYKLQREKHAARNLTIVSTDRVVQANAKSFQARIVPSAEFVRLVLNTRISKPSADGQSPDLSQRELDEWLDLFEGKK